MALIDVEQFIQEIKSRPLLYDKTLPQFTNRRRKENMWLEICSKLISSWETIDETDKDTICKDIQLKWKHIRDNFRREFHVQNKIKSGQATKTKKMYRYYKQLQFLIPFISYPDRIIYGKASKQETEDEESDRTPVINRRPKRILYQQKQRIKVNESSMKRNKKNDNDEDRYFCMSLMHSFKKMTDEAKINAKIDILNIIRRFSFPQSDFNQVYTDPLRYTQLSNQMSHNTVLQETVKDEYSPENSQDELHRPIRKKKRTRNHRNVQPPSPDSAVCGSANDLSG